MGGSSTDERPDQAWCGRGLDRRTGFERLWLELTERRGRRLQSAPSVSVSQNVDLASKLPESIKNAGVIKIGVDASYAPNEFLAGDGKTVQGMDVDRLQPGRSKFGVKTEWHPADFGSIINGVNGKKYDMGISSFTINPERMKQVNMVSYFRAGTQWATAKGNPKGVDPDNACGKNVAVQSNTTQEMDDLPVRQKKCGSNKINVLSFKDQSQATAAVVSGKADAMLSDSPVVAYAVKQSGGKLEPLGDIYEAAPYGYVLPKRRDRFRTGHRRGAQGDRQGRRLQGGPREVGRSAGRYL